jgi:hypothetical protein
MREDCILASALMNSGGKTSLKIPAVLLSVSHNPLYMDVGRMLVESGLLVGTLHEIAHFALP